MSASPAQLRKVLADRCRRARTADEARRSGAVERARTACGALAREHVLASAWVVGSAAWGGFGERSDLDVVVEGLAPEAAAAAADTLAGVAGLPVDLLRLEELPETFRERVRRDGVRLA
jgi:predicted nucleotidyltransferase